MFRAILLFKQIYLPGISVYIDKWQQCPACTCTWKKHGLRSLKNNGCPYKTRQIFKVCWCWLFPLLQQEPFANCGNLICGCGSTILLLNVHDYQSSFEFLKLASCIDSAFTGGDYTKIKSVFGLCSYNFVGQMLVQQCSVILYMYNKYKCTFVYHTSTVHSNADAYNMIIFCRIVWIDERNTILVELCCY